MNQIEYKIVFEADKHDSDKLKAAFAQVSDIRKFEIELYWKRATYFWALIAVAFAGYFSILASQHISNKFFLSLIVSCIGLVFTFAWFLSSRGSKYWQENWENHLDLLEDNITGPLYKTVLERPEGSNNVVERLVTGPLSVSVSKINQWVCFFVIFSWVTLICFSIYKSLTPLIFLPMSEHITVFLHFLIVLIAILCCLFMTKFGRTDDVDYETKAKLRKTILVE